MGCSGPPILLGRAPAWNPLQINRLTASGFDRFRYLRDRWDNYPAGTTFAGVGLSPVESTSF